MSVLMAQVNLAFKDRYQPRSTTIRFESNLKLSLRIVEITKKLMPNYYAECDSVYGVFFRKIQIMNQFSDQLAKSLDLELEKKGFWAYIFSRVIDESLPYSRDGRYR